MTSRWRARGSALAQRRVGRRSGGQARHDCGALNGTVYHGEPVPFRGGRLECGGSDGHPCAASRSEI